MIIGSISDRHFDSELDTNVCNADTNANLTLFFRIFLQRYDPPGGAGMVNEWGGTPRAVTAWPEHEWRHFCRRYQTETQDYWNGRFWLVTPDSFTELDWNPPSPTHRPNVYCRVRVSLVTSALNAHHTIRCVHLASTTRSFRSDSGNYDSRDLDGGTHADPGDPTDHHVYRQHAHLHEFGHLLGLGHSSQHRPQCAATGVAAGGGSICYGFNGAESNDVMGVGESRHEWHAEPWMRRMQAHTGIDMYAWGPLMRRVYPRPLSALAHYRMGRQRS